MLIELNKQLQNKHLSAAFRLMRSLQAAVLCGSTLYLRKKCCQLILGSRSVKYELISMKIGMFRNKPSTKIYIKCPLYLQCVLLIILPWEMAFVEYTIIRLPTELFSKVVQAHASCEVSILCTFC